MARDILRDRIESIQRAWRRTVLWEQVWLGVLVLTGLVAAAGLADLLVPLPAMARLVLWGLGAALALGGLVWLTATRGRRRIDPGRAALLAEKRYPHLQDQLASAVWYAGREEEETSSPVAAHLVDRLLTEARKEARILGFADVVPRGRLFRRLAAAAAAIGSLVLFGSVFPETVGAQLVRVLQPWRPVPPVLTTRVHVEPGDASLRRGSDQGLRAVLTGPGAPAADLHIRPGGGDWQSRPMEAAGPDTFTYELYSVDAGLEYFVRAGNGRSDTFRVEVYEPPELREVTVRYDFPEYTGRPQEVSATGHVRAVRGTRAEVTATYSKDLGEGWLATAAGDTLAAAVDGPRARYAFTLTDSTTYELGARDLQGREDESPRRFPIDAVPDAAPVILFPEPGGHLWAIPADVVPVSVEARDDFGLAGLRMRYSVDGGREEGLEMGEFPAPGAGRAGGGHTFDLGRLGGEPGLVTYYAEAWDHHAPGARRTVSDLQFIQVKPYQEPLEGFGGQCQAATQLLSSRQAALLQECWILVRSPAAGARLEAAADSLSGEQEALRHDLGRFLDAADLALDADGIAAGSHMDEAVKDLEATAPREAAADQQAALAALLRLEAKLPERLGSGRSEGAGTGDGGSGDAVTASRSELEEVLDDFSEQEQDRRGALFRRALDLLARARKELAVQAALNGAWTARVRGDASDPELLRRQQQEAAQSTARLAEGIAALETGIGAGPAASGAAGAAAGHMLEAAGLGGQGRPQAALARGVKARTRLEETVDALYLIVARNAGEMLPLLAGALDQLGRRQESMAAELERSLAGPPPWPLTSMRDRQRVAAASARSLRKRLTETAGEVDALSAEWSAAAHGAARALLDSSVEDRLEAFQEAFGDRRYALAAVPALRRVGAALRKIAADLAAAVQAAADAELARTAAALNATRALKTRVQGGGGGGLELLEQLYEPLDDDGLRAGLERLRDAGLGSGGGDGAVSAGSRRRALAALGELEALLEARIRRLAREAGGGPFDDDHYPPEYRELVQRYFRVLAEDGAVR